MTIREELSAWASLIKGNAWGLEEGTPRIYIPMPRRDVTVYFTFQDACIPTSATDFLFDAEMEPGVHGLGSASVNIYIDDCGQAPAWYRSQKEKIRRSEMVRRAALALDALDAGDEALAIAIMDGEGNVDDDSIYDAAVHEITNGRFSEARVVLGIS